MKKAVYLFIILLLAVSLTACSKSSKVNKTDNVKATENVSRVDETAADLSNADSVGTVDLTALSQTMVYTELYNMVVQPEDYIGKTVKMQGKYSVYDGDNRKYYVCEVTDATACCSQGLEFILKDGEDYPEYDESVPVTIEVSGTFNTYTEDDMQYVQLENATIKII